MRKFLITGLIALTLAPAMATAQTGELRRDRQDLRQEQRDLREARRFGDRGDVRAERRDVRDARQEYREDWRDYRRSNQAAFRQGRYVGPQRGWRYRPVAVGYRFQPAFYGQRYVIADPYRYRLPRAAGVNRWVRYGNDVVLVNTRNGRVVQVYNSFFY
ncbi:MAG TPA: RcnB family protein [Sphingomonas sp.]|jgi:Ni/Co efflux regulator RcnB|uniref:RcnB family protein n=1 Tax=Sphingomonas sp. TaxID=28214 RepID=UPI002EDB3EBA